LDADECGENNKLTPASIPGSSVEVTSAVSAEYYGQALARAVELGRWHQTRGTEGANTLTGVYRVLEKCEARTGSEAFKSGTPFPQGVVNGVFGKDSANASKCAHRNMPVIRRGEPTDLREILIIQAACPQAAQWDPTQYLNYDLLVAANGIHVAGFLAGRTLAPGEHEILNLAVAPEFRRQGLGRWLVSAYLEASPGAVFLEVRPSNLAARIFYKSLGFEEVTVRPKYYHDPPEPAIVMKFHSC